MSKQFYETNEFQVLRELHFNSRRESTGKVPTVRVVDLVSFKGWSKNKARRILKAMTDSGLLYKWGKRGAQVIWRWTGDGVTAFHEGRKAMWADNPLTPEQEAEIVRVTEACNEADEAQKAYPVCECGAVATQLFNLIDCCADCYAIGTEPVEVEPFAQEIADGLKLQAKWQVEAIKECEARTFDDRKSYCKQCFSEVDLWDDTDEGYTHCCNKRACEAREAREINASELRYLKGETE